MLMREVATMELLPPSDLLPEWLPDETVFSWASRYHQLSGHRLAAQTCRVLFGDRRHGSQHDFPTRLGQLVERTGDQLGPPSEIALWRTVLHYYLVPRTPEQITAAVDSLVRPTPGILKFRLGLLTGRFRANHPLKACPLCMAADELAFGSSYWHLAHQYPGMWVCRQHDVALQAATVKSTGVERFGWVLPAAAGLVDVVSPGGVAELRRFADFVAGWSTVSPGSLTTVTIAKASRDRLAEGSVGSAAESRATTSVRYAEFVGRLRCVPELQGLPSSAAQARSDINRWIFAPRGGTHPLRHLALISWLFTTWDDFVDAYAAAQLPGASPERPPIASSQPADARKLGFVAALRSGQSVTAASKLAGISVGTGIAWAAQHGIETGRRPKSITAPLYECISAELRQGDDKSDIAERNGVPVQAVTRVLRNEVGLAEQRRLALFERAQIAARNTWGAAHDAWPGATVAHLRSQAGAAYAWLRRHDKVWLDAHLPKPAPRPAAAPRFDWDRRDQDLAAAVRRVALELAMANPGVRLRPWQIYQALPELKAKQGALARLPLTARALAEVTRRETGSATEKLL
jgi:hypothetical protein